MNYKNQLNNAINYAATYGSFSKIDFSKKVDIVCAYGLGRFFKEAFGQWEFKKRMHVNLLCDSDNGKWGKIYDGLKCISPDELYELNKEKKILVITFIGKPAEINKALKKNDVFFVSAGDCIFEMICNMETSCEWFKRNNMLDILDWLEDEESKRVYTNAICNRIAPQFSEYDFDQLYSSGEYYETDAFEMNKNECFVDCGAYNGDTIERLLISIGGAVEHIYAFEMDKGNFLELYQNIKKLTEQYQIPSEKVCLFNAGVWNKKESLPYGKEEFGSGESFCLFKDEIVGYTELVKIDDLLQGKRVTFIKMDIEGAERNALEGAQNVILENKPKLAICLYHRLQDFWEIPTYVKSLLPQYRLFVRHHNKDGVGGTVLYAVEHID